MGVGNMTFVQICTFHAIHSKIFFVLDPTAMEVGVRNMFLWRSAHFRQFLANNFWVLDPLPHGDGA